MKRRNLISGLALTVITAALTPLENLFAHASTRGKESVETKLMGIGSQLLQRKP
ncbi:MAG: hypothetical protein JO334_08130, partial [Verrucomicrobia bacterium]|nr:hypothetical protein [Verrucomicrobiota bacterium]